MANTPHGCNCLAAVTADMGRFGAKIVAEDGRAVIATEKVGGKRGAWKVTLAASHCPFCGREYPAKGAVHG